MNRPEFPAAAVEPPAGPALPNRTDQAQAAWQGGWRQGLSYGGLGLPLAFVALPLYVVLPDRKSA